MKINVNGKEYTSNWLTDHDKPGAQSVLRSAHDAKVYPICLCSSHRPELSIRYRESSNLYYLASMPKTGMQHALACEFHGQTTEDAWQQTKPAKVTIGDGRYDINIDSVLVRKPRVEKGAARDEGKGRGSSRQSWTLRGLLEEMWEMANLHKWYPNRKYDRTINTVKRAIEEVAKDIVTKKHTLHDILVVPGWSKDRAHSCDINSSALEEKLADEGKGIILVGKLDQIVASKFNDLAVGLKINLINQILWMTPELTQRMQRQFQKELNGLNNANQHTMIICTVFKTKKTYSVGDVGIMRMSRQFIPVDSGYELQVIEKLGAEKRQFRKPLRLNGAGVLPDFVLTDTDTPVCMEVFGIENDPEYTARKQEKIRAYRKDNQPFWAWEPAREKNIPDFPKPKLC